MAKASCVREVYCRKNTGFGAKKQGFQTLTSCVALGKLLNFSEPQIPHLQNGNNIYLAGLLEEQIRYQVEYLDNGWHVEDRQGVLIFSPPPSTPIIHPST